MSQTLKIGLINVMLDGDYQYEEEIPIGLAAIGAFLREHGYDVEFKQCLASKGQDELDCAAALEADVYGFQLNMVNYPHVQAVVEKIKLRQPKAITIFGGPFLVAHSKEILAGQPLFDFIVIGEGELTTLELIQNLEMGETSFSRIGGLAWRDEKGDVQINGLRNAIEDLDGLAFPARDLLEKARHDGGVVASVRISTSRGCVARCSFCCVNLYSKMQRGKVWRGRSPQNVVDEIELLSKKYGVRVINFADSSFEDPGELGKERAAEICNEIIKRKIHLSAKVYMRCETMKTEKDIELLKLYKKAGIDVIIPGIEAGNDYELKIYGKRATLEDNIRTLGILKEIDLFYILTGFIMFGPYSTLETIKANITFMHKNGYADNIMLLGNVLMLLRESKIYQQLRQEGRIVDNPEKFWELPKYLFLDAKIERLSKHWQYGKLYSSYPDVLKVNNLQINLGNLISRMTNPMNAKIHEKLHPEYDELKIGYAKLRARFGDLQADYFIETINLVETDCSDEKLNASAVRFFGDAYSQFLPEYVRLYEGFLEKVKANNFGLSGLVFEAFHSAMAEKDTEVFSIK